LSKATTAARIIDYTAYGSLPAQGRRWSWGEVCASHHPSRRAALAPRNDGAGAWHGEHAASWPGLAATSLSQRVSGAC